MIGLSRAAIAFGLLDTGSELTILHASYIDDLDVRIKPGDYETLIGVGGEPFQALCGTIDFELASGRRRTVHRWRARVAFVEQPKVESIILGHEGFLEHFSVSFHGPGRWVTIAPRGPLPRHCMPIP